MPVETRVALLSSERLPHKLPMHSALVAGGGARVQGRFGCAPKPTERPIIKAVNLTPYNYLKHGMNLTSLEAIFERDVANVLV